jgi:hypothetical protein
MTITVDQGRGGGATLSLALRFSLQADTRKPVNYTCIGRSQGKLWWRAVALLTCKSFRQI